MPFKSWSEEDISLLRKLRAAGASAARVSVAVKKTLPMVRAKARELGIPFEPFHLQRKLRKDRERAARVAAGLPPE